MKTILFYGYFIILNISLETLKLLDVQNDTFIKSHINNLKRTILLRNNTSTQQTIKKRFGSP